MVGVSILCNTTGGASRRSNSPVARPAPSAPMPSPDAAAPTSRPAHQARPAPVMTMARTSGSRSASMSRSDSRASMPLVMVFIRSGRLKVMVPTWSATSYRMSSLMAPGSHSVRAAAREAMPRPTRAGCGRRAEPTAPINRQQRERDGRRCRAGRAPRPCRRCPGSTAGPARRPRPAGIGTSRGRVRRRPP